MFPETLPVLLPTFRPTDPRLGCLTARICAPGDSQFGPVSTREGVFEYLPHTVLDAHTRGIICEQNFLCSRPIVLCLARQAIYRDRHASRFSPGMQTDLTPFYRAALKETERPGGRRR